VIHDGALAPLLLRICPDVPAAVNAYAVLVPYETPPGVGAAVLLVPPSEVGTVPSESVRSDASEPPPLSGEVVLT
jgi:hypothetical protein